MTIFMTLLTVIIIWLVVLAVGEWGSIYKSFERPSKETMDSMFGIVREDTNPPRLGEDNTETYYVVEVNGRYYENDARVMSGTELHEHTVSTTDSLLECKRFYSKPDAQRVECE